MSINRYFAWYRDSGRSQLISLQMPNEVKSWYETYKKPVLVTEYGAGSVAGMHQVKFTHIGFVSNGVSKNIMF